MRRTTAILVAVVAGAIVTSPAVAAASPSVAALQIALRAKGHYPAVVDGVQGPVTKNGLLALQRAAGVDCTGHVGRATRRALGRLGRPLLGQRVMGVGSVGWDVSVLEFRLAAFGLPATQVDGRFTAETANALRRFQRRHRLVSDGIVGRNTFRVLARDGGKRGQGAALRPRPTHVVRPGESFYAIAARYRVSPLVLAERNGLELATVLVPGQKLALPRLGHVAYGRPAPARATPRGAVRGALDRWSAEYGVDPRLSRAVAWMESGFQQDVVSHAGAVGVMQLLPGTWEWVDTMLLGTATPRTYDGNVRAGVRYLRWLIDEFDGDTRLALAGYYQGARAVRERGLFDDTKQYVSVVLRLYGSV